MPASSIKRAIGTSRNGLSCSLFPSCKLSVDKSRTQGSLNDNISRLASGLRINKTADDSTGANVSIRMNNQLVRSVETAKYIGRIALEIRPIGLGNRLTWAI